ncbi:MAG: CorA family divalent cation transporter [bacterium]|nr:CorA family divalent cation transporter [bacterium]
MEHVKAYLYDSRGKDEEIDIESADVARLGDQQLLWINITRVDGELLHEAVEKIGIKGLPRPHGRYDECSPDVERYDEFFRFSVDSVLQKDGGGIESCRVRFLVGKNYVVIMHDGQLGYFDEFRQREKGESKIGDLGAESFVATLLDVSLVTYFKAMDDLEKRVDKLDEEVLKKDVDTDKFLERMVALRRETSNLRRWLMPQREVYYALARADFHQIAQSDSAEQYRTLSQHFEAAVDAIEHARETVISVFELYATKSSHLTNVLVQRLTFFTLVLGSIAVIAGILGMNFKAGIFDLEYGFWIAVAGLFAVGLGLTIVARFKRWI